MQLVKSALRLVHCYKMSWLIDNFRTSPVVVHCSDGVGATGTVIGLDTIANAIDANKTTLDVYGVVHNMRKDKCLMVRYFNKIVICKGVLNGPFCFSHLLSIQNSFFFFFSFFLISNLLYL